MRTACLIFVLLCCAATMALRDYASTRGALPQQTSGASSADAASANASDHAARMYSTKTNQSDQLPTNERSIVGHGRNLHQPGSFKNAFVAKGSQVRNKSDHTRPAGQPKVVTRSAMMARRGGSNAAFVGGLPNTTAKGTATLNGTHMNHKR